MGIGEATWIFYIARQIKTPVDEVRKRTRVHYWKDKIEIYDLGIFVPFLEAEQASELSVGELGIVYERSQEGVEPTAHISDKVAIYTYKQYLSTLAMECSSIKIFNSSGEPVQLSEKMQEFYKKNRDALLKGSKFRHLE